MTEKGSNHSEIRCHHLICKFIQSRFSEKKCFFSLNHQNGYSKFSQLADLKLADPTDWRLTFNHYFSKLAIQFLTSPRFRQFRELCYNNCYSQYVVYYFVVYFQICTYPKNLSVSERERTCKLI